ncbi:MAG TPA: translational GTPase TypA, partial [Ruminococcus sp.]|nr:translational GTPase TypA [Ruminococcus sp.]
YEEGKDLKPLFDTIINYIDAPQGEEDEPLQMLISSIDYNEYVGRIGIGRIERGRIKVGQQVTVADYTESKKAYNSKIVSLLQIQGLNRVSAQEAKVGDIVWVSGIENITIGDTLCDPAHVEPIPFVKISEPTVEMTFSVNDSPFAGREGKFVTSRQLRERLFRELLRDVSLRVTETDSTDSFKVAGRG